MKGIYTITKRKAEFVDGEWVAGDIIEVLPPTENRITPWLAEMLRTNDTAGKTTTQLIVAVDETVYNGALVKEGQSAVTLNTKGTLLFTAAYTAATGVDDSFYEIISTINPPPGVSETVTFADANPDTITRTGGTSFLTSGFGIGMTIVITGSASNDGTYTIANVTSTIITLKTQDTLVAEGPVSCAISALRQIRTVYLTSNDVGSPDDVYSIVNLTTPCPQTNLQILQINYKIILDQTTLQAEGTRSVYANEAFFSQSFTNIAPAFANAKGYITHYDNQRWGTGLKFGSAARYASQVANTEMSVDTLITVGPIGPSMTLSKQGCVQMGLTGQLGTSNISTNSTEWCGYPIKGYALGNIQGLGAVATIDKGTPSSVQNTFGKAADTGTTRKPFLDTTVISTSAASINLLDKGDWIDHISDSYTLPYLYRITMETGGLVGAATYKLWKRRFCRWIDNNDRWYPGGMGLAQMNVHGNGLSQPHMDQTTKSNIMHGQLSYFTTITASTQASNVLNSPILGWTGYITQRYVYPEFITFDYTGITICDINQQYVNIDTDSTVALNVTGILQVDCDGADIYVAGEDTGLFKIEREIGDFNDANLTVRLLSPPGITDATSCRGVAAKGGGRHGHPGKIIAVRIMRSGSNYAVGDTVTFAGSLGASATARVATVDADGGITSVAVTNQGSGYIEDNIQAYVSSGSGLGASLDPVIGSGGNIWALFNDVTDGFMYLAHMTHIGSNDYTSGLAFAATGDTITRTDGTSFLADGFRIGMKIIVRTAEDAGNIGTFTITAVTATVITVSEALTDTTVGTDTQARIFGEQWEIMTETITDDSTNLDFLSAGPDTITGDGTSFVTQGFREGMKIVVSSANTGANNGIYTIASVSATVITLDVNDVLTTDASDATAVLSTLTDFTIASYTSGSPGRTGFIGLQIDPDHVDDRFAMITPAVKNANDGTAVQATTDGGLDWWSFANSTGTTTAGGTDGTRVGSTINNASSAIEQFGPNTVGPFGTANEWTCNGLLDTSIGYMTWGSTAIPVARPLGSFRCYNPIRNAAGNIAVTCKGTVSNQQWRTCSTIAQMASGTLSDSILLWDFGLNDTTDLTPANYDGTNGCAFGYLGKGMFWTFQWDFDTDPSGFHVWTCNGNGTRAVSEALPNGFWDEYGWDGTRWVLGNASAKTTHAEVTFSGTGITITAAAGTIVGAGFASTDWAGDGFLVGDTITIASSEDAANNGVYTIEQLSGTTLTVTPDALPAVNTTSAPDTTATVVGSHALIDGIAISFDDNTGIAAFVINEYYDTHLYDGILKDNATNFNVDTYYTWAADDIGTTFSDSGSPTTTIPSANEGAVTNEPLTALYWHDAGLSNLAGFAERGVCCWHGSTTTNGTAFAHKIPLSTDFVLRFKIAGAFSTTNEIHVGVCPWVTITDLTDTILIAELDENIQVVYDGRTYSELDQYTVNVRDTGNGTVLLAYAADRVQAVVGQTQVDFDGVTGGYGDFIDGAGYANSDVITMDDGSTVTVVTQTGGQVTTFTVSTPSLQSSGRTERIVASTGYTNLAYSGSVVTRTAGNFTTDGYLVGMKLIIDASTGASNDGVWTITAVGTTTMTVAETFATEPTSVAGYFGTGLYQVGVSPAGGTGFALTLGTHNEVAVAALLGGTDEFSMHRIGTGAGNTTWRLNGVVFYTYAGALHTAADMGIVAHPDNTWGATLYDGSIDYTIDRRFLKVGNGTTTGANDLNFRCLPSLTAGTNMLRLYYNGVEFVYVTNGYTAPAAGEVSIIPMQGGLWFNTAQDGATITGNWTITKGYNLQ